MIEAVATAEADKRKRITASDAEHETAKRLAEKLLIQRRAEREAAAEETEAAKLRAEAVKAEKAAPGLADAHVKEVKALAFEKEGLAEARVMREKLQAEASGIEQKGLAEAKVKEADADAVQKFGLAEAKVYYERQAAEAKATEEAGMAQARVKEADAVAVEKRGAAEASALEKRGLAQAIAIKEKLSAEASGMSEKAEAMKAQDEVQRDREEFRLKLEMAKAIKMESIAAQKEIAQAQASVLGEAFKSADINIVGGDGEFFDKFTQAVSVGKSIDGLVNNSDTIQTAFSGYLNGEESLGADLKEILSRPALNSGDAANLSLAAVLGQLASNMNGEKKAKIAQLIEHAKELGLDA